MAKTNLILRKDEVCDELLINKVFIEIEWTIGKKHKLTHGSLRKRWRIIKRLIKERAFGMGNVSIIMTGIDYHD
uniref:Uncharacterized protein n=1 Tax=viral metagenome TaxID=1070528 RepID=A0A6M3JHY5_9ZZZZ